jgi:4-amino-4-deoxy-L-arabinose transferase-like glycosyltransferase
MATILTQNNSPAPATAARGLAVVLVAAAVIRAMAILAQFAALEDDPDGYRRLAVTLRETGVFGSAELREGLVRVRPTAYRPPLYPMLLSLLATQGSVAPAAVAALHVLLGAATAGVVFVTARNAGLGRWAYFAAAITALDPILLRQSALVMTETLAAFLASLGMAALARPSGEFSLRRAAAAGAVLGLSVLCRPTFAAWVALAVLAIAASRSIPHRGRIAGVALVFALLTTSPWVVRNMLQFGKPIITTTHGGYTLWLANNDLYYDQLLERGGLFDARRLAPQLTAIRDEVGENEVAFDRRLTQEAIDTMKRRPAAFAYATFHRLHDLWRLTPRRTGSESTLRSFARFAVGAWYGAMFLLALWGLVVQRRQLARWPWLGGLLLCLAFTLVHSLYWTDMRMRAPLIPAIELAAAAGARAVFRRSPRDAQF